MNIFRAGALVAAALSVALSANAGVTSTATLTGLRYELFDLDANDGIAASISFAQGVTLSAQTEIENIWGIFPKIHNTTAPANSSATAWSNASATASFVDFPNNSLQATATVALGHGEEASGITQDLFFFTLGAHTGVRWFADSVLTSSYSGVGGDSYSGGFSYFGVNLDDSHNLANGQAQYATPSQHYLNLGLFYSPMAQNGFATFQFEVKNTSTEDLVLRGHALAYAGVRSTYLADEVHPPISAIPEPETYALILVGIGFMGAVVRRRKATLV